MINQTQKKKELQLWEGKQEDINHAGGSDDKLMINDGCQAPLR